MSRTERHYPISEQLFNERILFVVIGLHKRVGRPPLISHYQIFCAVFFILRTGTPWRDLPGVYGNWHTIYTRFKRWCEWGWFWQLLYALQSARPMKVEVAWIDSTYIILHRHGSGALKSKGKQSIGRGRKGLGTKIHIGLSPKQLKAACLSPAQNTDMKAFPALWKAGNWKKTSHIVGDKGYDSANARQPMREAGIKPVIPRKINAPIPGVQEPEIYKTRVKIEHFFGHVKEMKRMALRCDKLDLTFFSFFAMACIKVLKLLCYRVNSYD